MAKHRTWFNRFQTEHDVKIRKFAETMVSRSMIHCCFVDRRGITNVKKTATDSPIPMKTTAALINVFIGDQELYSVAQDICQGIITKSVKTQAKAMEIDNA